MKPFLWTSPDYETYTGPDLNNEMIARAEALLQVKLPQSYLDALRVQNGGYINYAAYPSPVPDSFGEEILTDYLLGIDGPTSILNTPEWRKEWKLPAQLVPLCGDGYWWIALDYRPDGPAAEPRVTYLHNQAAVEEDQADVDWQEYPLAPNFSAFLDGLILGGYDHIFGIVTALMPWQELASQINDCLDIDLQRRPHPVTGVNIIQAEHPMWFSSLPDHNASFTLYPDPDRQAEPDVLMLLHPECAYFFTCDVSDPEYADEIHQRLRECLHHEVIKVYTPYSTMYGMNHDEY